MITFLFQHHYQIIVQLVFLNCGIKKGLEMLQRIIATWATDTEHRDRLNSMTAEFRFSTKQTAGVTEAIFGQQERWWSQIPLTSNMHEIFILPDVATLTPESQ